jgi:uncharacterized protein
MDRGIDYGNLMHRAMRGLIRDVMERIADQGLPGAHYFLITLDTHHDGLEMAGWLRERYPDDITIVIQHWFDNLAVDDDGFAITLSFGNQPEPLYIPFDAITAFADPSVPFGLKFETQTDEDDEDDDEQTESAKPGEVVSLDKFRK